MLGRGSAWDRRGAQSAGVITLPRLPMTAAVEWARAALQSLLLQTANKLAAQRERERLEAERWLRKLQAEARERQGKAPR